MTTDERPEDKWDIPKPQRKLPEGPPQETYQIFCYIREGPGTPSHGEENSRYSEEFVGVPTSKQVEEWVILRETKQRSLIYVSPF